MLLNISSKTRKVAVASVGVAALTSIALANGATASAKIAPGAAIRGHAVVHGLVQSKLACAGASGQDDSGIAIVSQDFTDSGFDAYDSQGADDFKVTATCKIKTVTAFGQYFNGAGPAASENVTFYSGKKTPTTVIKSYNLAGADSAGTFTITLPSALKLKPGHYWVSVQAVMAFGTGGEWGWEMTATSQSGKASQWQNPGDGFATGCTTYTTTTTCIPSGEGPDFLFALG